LGEESGTASAAWRAANEAAREEQRRGGDQDDLEDVPLPDTTETWIDEGIVRDEAEGAVRRGQGSRRGAVRGAGAARRGQGSRRSGIERDEDAGQRGQGSRRSGIERDEDAGQRGQGSRRSGVARGEGDKERPPRPPVGLVGKDDEVAAVQKEQAAGNTDDELRAALGATKGARAEQRLRDAGDAFRRGRFDDARRILKPLAESAPGVAGLRELYGLSLYRLGRWKQAVAELEAFRTLSDSVDQHPVLADSYRALGRYHEVEALWDELRAASPSSELVAEGRIVAAGALADQGRLDDALALLEPAVKPARRAKPHHLRVAYALADLYERAGDLPRARELFQRVAAADPDFVDIQSRLAGLR
jgi:thioredoxin-like negative regulator of GroEL